MIQLLIIFYKIVTVKSSVQMTFQINSISWDITSFCLQSFRVFLFLSLITFIVFFRNIVISADQRKPPQGKHWKLPPGPPTSPIVGNLLQMLEVKADSSRYSAYVSSASTLKP